MSMTCCISVGTFPGFVPLLMATVTFIMKLKSYLLMDLVDLAHLVDIVYVARLCGIPWQPYHLCVCHFSHLHEYFILSSQTLSASISYLASYKQGDIEESVSLLYLDVLHFLMLPSASHNMVELYKNYMHGQLFLR